MTGTVLDQNPFTPPALDTTSADAPPSVVPFALWRPSQFLAYAPDSSACLLGDGYVEKGEWTSLVGIGGLGKTRLALSFAIAQQLGKSWCGLPTGGVPQKAVILSTENGVRRWKYDLERLFRALSADEQRIVEEHLRILALTPDDDPDLCLGSPAAISRLRATLTSAAPGLVIFDPFADMIDGDENKTADVVGSLRALRQVLRVCPSAAVLIIHHARTGAQNVAQAGDNFSAGNFGRGAKALYSRVRCEIQLAPQDRDDPNRLVLACGKANNCEKFTTRGLTFDPETFTYTVDPGFDAVAWRADVAGKRRKASGVTISDVVKATTALAPVADGQASTQQIALALEDLGCSLRSVQRVIHDAVRAGYLRNGSKRGLWRLGAKPLPR